MGQFADLLPTQERLLRTLAEYYLEKEVSTWLVSVAKGGACLIACDGQPTQNVDGVPASDTFYLGLERSGYLTVGYSGREAEITICKPTLDYSAYSRKTRLSRCCQDIAYDLVHQTSLLAKLVIYVLGVVSGIVVTVASGILLRVLGWINIGS